MKTIWVDFNARTEDDRIRLDTAGSLESLAKTPVRAGEWVWLSDDDVLVGGRIEPDNSKLLARPAWPTLEDKSVTAADEEIQAALAKLRALLLAPAARNYGEILRQIPVARLATPDLGYLEYLKSRALQALGYPELALATADEAVVKGGANPAYRHHRLTVLENVDHRAALDEVRRMLGERLPALVLEACLHVLGSEARRLQGEAQRRLDEEIVAVATAFETAAGRAEVAPSAVMSVCLERGFALGRLGRDAEALRAFDGAVESNPASATPRLARGVARYPSQRAVEDLSRAIELGWPSYLPHYFLAHHCVVEGRWEEVRRLANAAIRLRPPASARANLLEWQAIVAFEIEGDVAGARKMLLEALAIADLPHVHHNLQELESLAAKAKPATTARARWDLVPDEPAGSRAAAAIAA